MRRHTHYTRAPSTHYTTGGDRSSSRFWVSWPVLTACRHNHQTQDAASVNSLDSPGGFAEATPFLSIRARR